MGMAKGAAMGMGVKQMAMGMALGMSVKRMLKAVWAVDSTKQKAPGAT